MSAAFLASPTQSFFCFAIALLIFFAASVLSVMTGYA